MNLIKLIARKIFGTPVDTPQYEEKREIILYYKRKYGPEILVETGTFMGDTIQSLIKKFKLLYSIELSEDLASRARQRFTGDEHVTIINGSSDIELKSILEKLNEPALFWLDGHYSGEFTYNDEFIKTAKGTLNTPVVAELQLIYNSAQPHIILIDDARLFNGTQDYPTIRVLKNMLKQSRIKRTLSVERDIIRIVPVTK